MYKEDNRTCSLSLFLSLLIKISITQPCPISIKPQSPSCPQSHIQLQSYTHTLLASENRKCHLKPVRPWGQKFPDQHVKTKGRAGDPVRVYPLNVYFRLLTKITYYFLERILILNSYKKYWQAWGRNYLFCFSIHHVNLRRYMYLYVGPGERGEWSARRDRC